MTCAACSDPTSGIVNAACRACLIRDIARGPHFFDSMRHGKLTDAYKASLRAMGDVAAVHLEVKEAAKGFVTGAAP